MKLNTFYKQGAALALCLTLSFPVFAEKDLVQYVNTLQGTNSTYELSWGNTYPTTAVPYPMNSWSPQTGKNGDGWKYQYSATTIRGFQPTHQCSPWVGDYGVFSLMPVSELVVDESKRATPFSHDKEIAKPHYYKVTLENGITTEFSPTTRSAHFRFSFPAKGDAFLVLDGYTKTSQVQIGSPAMYTMGLSLRRHIRIILSFNLINLSLAMVHGRIVRIRSRRII